MAKDFQPFSNLWITADSWFSGIKGWMNSEWETVNGDEAMKFVEEALKTLN